jgi:Uma2 family endonuclease
MADLTIPATFPAGEIVALNVSAEEYMEKYAADFYEWVQGAVIKMAPISLKHDFISRYLDRLLDAYFARNPIGTVLRAPFVMRVDAVDSRREPDIQVVLQDNPGKLTETATIGPADICIEIVSEESFSRDYGDKHKEYERAGVKEYWLIDPLRKRHHFYRLDDESIYQIVPLGEGSNFYSPLLPKFKLHVPTLWQDTLPNFIEIGEFVKAMFTD